MLKLLILLSMAVSVVFFTVATVEMLTGHDASTTVIAALVWCCLSNTLRLNRIEVRGTVEGGGE